MGHSWPLELTVLSVTRLVPCDAALEETIFAKNRPQMYRRDTGFSCSKVTLNTNKAQGRPGGMEERIIKQK